MNIYIYFLVIRDYDNHCYFRPWGDSVMAGAFELTAKPIFHDGVPDTFNCARDRLTEDWDQLRKFVNVEHLVIMFKTCCFESRNNNSHNDMRYMIIQAPTIL